MRESYILFHKTKEFKNKRRYYAEFFTDINKALNKKEKLQKDENIIFVNLQEGRIK